MPATCFIRLLPHHLLDGCAIKGSAVDLIARGGTGTLKCGEILPTGQWFDIIFILHIDPDIMLETLRPYEG